MTDLMNISANCNPTGPFDHSFEYVSSRGS